VLVRLANFIASRARTAPDAWATLVVVFGRLLGRVENVTRKSVAAIR